MYSRFTLIVILLICLSVNTIKADTIPHIYTGFQANYGFIIPHSKSIEAVSHTKPYGFEVSINRLHTSFDKWQIFNAYWISGIETGYLNFQNPQVLGSVFTVTVFAEPVVSFGKRFFLTVRGGAGFSYHTKVYDETYNPSNLFFSTRISFPLYLDARLKYSLGNHAYFTLSGCYNHISNGSLKQPNKGMNFPTLAAGLEYFYRDVPLLNHDFTSDLTVPKPGIFCIIQGLTAVKIIEEAAGFPEKHVFVYGFHTRISKQLNRFYSLNAGAELIFDGYIREIIKREQTDLDNKRFALTAGQDFLFGKVVFTQYLGFYVYSPYKARNQVYQKYELAYRFHPNFMVGVYLKSHLHVAELMGVNVNWLIPGNKN